MLSPHIYAAFAHERHQTFLAQAESDRRNRQARLQRWRGSAAAAVTGRPFVLRDGSAVLIRPVRRADAPLLADGFARLSTRSRQMRFLTPKKELSPAELRYFTDVDHHDHEALGALDHVDGRGVGIARYVRDAEDPQAAEIAVTVVDDWQGRGLGTELVAQLSERACCEGIRRFTALVTADNPAMAGLLRNVQGRLIGHEPGALQYEVILRSAEEYSKAGVPSSSGDPPARLPDPTAPESAAVTIVSGTRQATARTSAKRLRFSDTYSGCAQPGAEGVGELRAKLSTGRWRRRLFRRPARPGRSGGALHCAGRSPARPA